jgi:hypothetical protein
MATQLTTGQQFLLDRAKTSNLTPAEIKAYVACGGIILMETYRPNQYSYSIKARYYTEDYSDERVSFDLNVTVVRKLINSCVVWPISKLDGMARYQKACSIEDIDKSKYSVVLTYNDGGEPYQLLGMFETYDTAITFISTNPNRNIDLLHNGRFISWQV